MASREKRRAFSVVPPSTILSLLLCVQLVFTAPAPTTLQNGDSSQVVRFAYKTGQTYVYNFNSDVLTQVVGTSDDESRLNVKGQVLLTAQSSNEFVLTVKQASIQSASGQAVNAASQLVGSSIGFTNEDGVLKCGISLEKDDPVWSANIKRALASLFTNHAYSQGQFAAASYQELDISGKGCVTSYTISGNKYIKKRNLATCSKRDGGYFGEFGVPYTSDAEEQSETLFTDATQECTQEFDSGILKSTDCVEVYEMQPFRNGNAGVQTTIKSSLNYASTSNEVKSPAFDSSQNAKIFFDYSEEDSNAANTHGANTLTILKGLCTEFAPVITSSEVTDQYFNLKKEVQGSNLAGLQAAYNSINCPDAAAKTKVQNLFLNAVATAGTSDAVTFFATRYDESSPKLQRAFRLYTAFALKPNDNALSAVLNLLKSSSAKDFDKLLLSASGFAHQYSHNSPNSEQSSVYQDLVAFIANYASSNCQAKDTPSVEKAIAGLQGLGNLHSLTSGAVQAIQGCLGASVSERVQINALQGFRKAPCSPELQQSANNILANKQSPAHVRIHAYLAVSKCLSQADANAINNILSDQNEIDQVQRFICSHVSNTLGSVSAGRNKPNYQNIFKLINCDESFAGGAANIGKYSTNLESSHYEESYNGGYSAEANIIYSPDSFVPKTFSTNFTFDYAGNAYGFVEFGVNSFDYEEYLESVFGPKGKKPQSFDAPFSQSFTRKRRAAGKSVAPSFDKISTLANSVAPSRQARETKGVSDFYVRWLGTTIGTKSFTMEELRGFYLAGKNKPGKDFWADLFLINKKIDEANQLPLYSDELLLPTISGFPLKLQADGSAILSLKSQNQLNSDELSIDGSTKVSATVLGRGKFIVGAGPVQAGVVQEAKFYGSHNAGLKLKVKRDNEQSASIEARISTPEEQIRSWEISSRLYWLESSDYAIPSKKEVNSKLGSGRAFAINYSLDPIGLTTSVSGTFPGSAPDSPKFPLTGAASVSGYLGTSDPSVNELYILLDAKDNVKETPQGLQGDRLVTFVFDTPGSSANRKIEFIAKSNYNGFGNTDVEFSYVSPRQNAKLVANQKTVGTAQDSELKASLNGKDYGVKVHSDIVQEEEEVSGLTKTTKAAFEVSYYTPDSKGTLLKGNSEAVRKSDTNSKSGKLTLKTETAVQGRTSEVNGVISYNFVKGGRQAITVESFKASHSNLGEVSLSGDFWGSTDKNLYVDLAVEYGQKTLNKLSVLLRADGSKPNVGYLHAKLDSTRRPELNFEAKWERDFAGEQKKVKFSYNRASGSVDFSSDFKPTGAGFVANSELKASCKKSNTDFSANSKIEQDGKKVNADLTINSGSNLNAVSKFDADYASHNYNFNSQGNAYGKDYSYVSSLTTEGSSKKHQLTAKVGDLFDVDAATELVQEDAKISFVSVVKSGKLPKPITFRQELYSGGSFKSQGYRSAKKSVTQVLLGTNRVTSLTFEKSSPTFVKVEVYQLGFIQASVEAGLNEGAAQFNGDVNIPHPSIQRRVVSKFLAKPAPGQFDFEAELQLDANNDPEELVAVKSSTTYSGGNINSKNSLDIIGEKRELNVDAKLEPQLLNADHGVNINYISGGKTYSLGLETRLDATANVKGGKTAVNLNIPGQRPLKFNLDTKLSDLDVEKLFFDLALNYQGDISDDDTKDQFLNIKVSRKPVNSGRHFNLEANGRLISASPKGVSVDVDVAKNSVQVRYVRQDGGNKVATINVDLTRDISAPLKLLSGKLQYDNDLSSPKPTFNADFTYKYTFSSFKDFEITEVFALSYEFPDNYLETSGENYFKINANEFAFSTLSKLQRQGDASPVTVQDIEVRASSQGSKYNALIDIRNLFLFPASVEQSPVASFKPKIQIDVEPNLPNVQLSINVDRAPVVNNFKLNLGHEESSAGGGQKRSTKVNANVGDQSYGFTSGLEFASSKAAVDFGFKFNNDPEKKLSLLVADSGSGPTAEASVKWGDGPNESVATKGNVVRSANGGFDADLVFDQTPLSSKWILKVKRNVASANQATFELNAESPDTNQIVKFSVDRNIDLAAQSSVKANYEIALAKYVSGKHAGKFALDLNRPNKELSMDFEASKDSKVVDNSKIVIKAAENEKLISIKSNCDAAYCIDATASLKTSENSGALETVVVYKNFKYGFEVDGSKSGDGARVDTKVLFGRNGQQQEYAVNIYKEKGDASEVDLAKSDISSAPSSVSRYGVDAKLGPRTISVVSANGQYSAPQASSCQLNIFLDKSRQPGDKFAWAFIQIPKNNDNSRNFILVSQNPGVAKFPRIKTTRSLQSEGSNFDVKVEFDVYKKKEDAITISFAKSGSEENYSIDFGAQSEGQGISLKESCAFQSQGNNYGNLDCSVSLKSPGEADASYKFSASASQQSSSVKFQQLAPEVKNYYSTAEFTANGCLKSLEYALPGFEAGETRYIQIEELDAPKGYNLKTYLKSEGDDYTEFYVGQVVGQGLGAKLTRTEKGVKNDLFEVRRVENSTHLRSYEVTWNAENIKKSLSRLEAIQVQRAGSLAATLKARAENVRRRVQGIGQSIVNANIDFDPAYEYLKAQVSAIGSELSIKSEAAVNKIEKVRAFAKSVSQTVPESVLSKALDKIADAVAASKETTPKLFAALKQKIDALGNAKNIDLEELFAKQILAGIRSGYAKFKQINDKIQNAQDGNKNLNKALVFVRGQISSKYAAFAKSNAEDYSKMFPYPEVKAAYEPVASYIQQRIATPNKKTLNDDFREQMFAKLDAAIKAILKNTFYADFKGGHVVVNIPVITQLSVFKQLLAVKKDRGSLSKFAFALFKPFPPAGAGVIYGVKEYKSFDGVSRGLPSFEGSNQYVLAAAEGNAFTVGIDFTKNGDVVERSLYLSNNQNKAIIISDGSVFLDGKRSVAGAKGGSLQVERQSGYIGVVDNANGVAIACETPGRFTSNENLNCIVRVSGYYHGRMNGLLGNFNSEASDDNDEPQQSFKLN